jgi:hypothetical protein
MNSRVAVEPTEGAPWLGLGRGTCNGIFRMGLSTVVTVSRRRRMLQSIPIASKPLVETTEVRQGRTYPVTGREFAHPNPSLEDSSESRILRAGDPQKTPRPIDLRFGIPQSNSGFSTECWLDHVFLMFLMNQAIFFA